MPASLSGSKTGLSSEATTSTVPAGDELRESRSTCSAVPPWGCSIAWRILAMAGAPGDDLMIAGAPDRDDGLACI